MSNQVVVTNTLAFLFPTGAAQPTIEEMACFVKTLVANKSELESAYKISEARSVYVKFKSEAAMKIAIKRNPLMHAFHYSNGKVVEVRMSIAGNNVRYVRIFDLPPEIPDVQISIILERYGKVKCVEREKFPAHLGLGDLFTGVRGIHIDLEKDTPPILRFLGRKERIYHDEMKPKCYVCFSEGHLKAACPDKKVDRDMNGNMESASSNENEGIEQKKEAGGGTTEQDNEEKQINKRQHQKQKQTELHYQQKPLKSGSWTEDVQLHSKAIEKQQKGHQSTTEVSPVSSPPRKNHRSDSPIN